MSAPQEMPLFPLNVVLFPTMGLPLHIFEPRYQLMIAHCLTANEPFGVVLISSDNEIGELKKEPHRVGTAVTIREVQRLADGRLNIHTLGTSRFRVLEFRYNQPYLSAITEPLVDEECNPDNLLGIAGAASDLFQSYFSLIISLAGRTDPPPSMPPYPEDLSYFIASCLDIENLQKQSLLELTSTLARLQQEVLVLRREEEFLRRLWITRTENLPRSTDRSFLN